MPKLLKREQLNYINNVYNIIITNFIYSIIGSIVAVISERPKIKWFDDDLAMQIIPITVLVTLNWFDLLPDLVKDGVIIGGGIWV